MKIYLTVNLFILFLLTSISYAHHKIYSPRVEEGRQSAEWRGHFDLDNRSSKNLAHHHVLETEYSWSNFWQTELEFHISDLEGTPMDWEKTEFQNQVQLVDSFSFAAALYFSYNFVTKGEGIDEIEYKYLNELNNNNFKLITNIIFEKKVGKHSSGSTEFTISNYFLCQNPIFNDYYFSILGFSEFGKLSNFSTYHGQEHQYGFQIEKELKINAVVYEFAIGYLRSLTDSSADNTLIWNFEYEF